MNQTLKECARLGIESLSYDIIDTSFHTVANKRTCRDQCTLITRFGEVQCIQVTEMDQWLPDLAKDNIKRDMIRSSVRRVKEELLKMLEKEP